MFTEEGHSALEGEWTLQISDVNDRMLYLPFLFVVLETNIGHNV